MAWKASGLDGGGHVNAVAISPTDSRFVLAAGDVQGFQRSTDGGKTWETVSRDLGGSPQQMRTATVAWHPTLAGVAFGGTGSGASGRGTSQGGFFYSVDYGATWTFATRVFSDTGTNAGGFEGADTQNSVPASSFPRLVGELIFADANFVYACTVELGVRRAPIPAGSPATWGGNAFQTWTLLGLNGIHCCAGCLIGDGDTLYVGTMDGNGGTGNVAKITGRQGAAPFTVTWMTGTNRPCRAMDFVLIGNQMYAVSYDQRTAANSGLFRLANPATAGGTATWSRINQSTAGTNMPTPVTFATNGSDPPAGSSCYTSVDGYTDGTNTHLWIQFMRGDSFAVTGGNTYKSVQYGFSNDNFVADGNWNQGSAATPPSRQPFDRFQATYLVDDVGGPNTPARTFWNNYRTWFGGNGNWKSSHLRIDPATKGGAASAAKVFVAGGQGVWRSDNGGRLWYPSCKYQHLTQMQNIGVDPKRPADRLYAGTVDWGQVYSTDLGGSYSKDHLPPGMAGDGTGHVGYCFAFDQTTGAGLSSRVFIGWGGRDFGYFGGAGSPLTHIAYGTDPAVSGWTNMTLPASMTNGLPTSLLTYVDSASRKWLLVFLGTNAAVGNGIFRLEITGNVFNRAWTEMTYNTPASGGVPGANQLSPNSWMWLSPSGTHIYCYDRKGKSGAAAGLWRHDEDPTVGSWVRIANWGGDDKRIGFAVPHPTNNGTVFVSNGDGVWRCDGTNTATEDSITPTRICSTSGTLVAGKSGCPNPGAMAVNLFGADDKIYVCSRSGRAPTIGSPEPSRPKFLSIKITDAMAATGTTTWDQADDEYFRGAAVEPVAITVDDSTGRMWMTEAYDGIQAYDPNVVLGESFTAPVFDTDVNSTTSNLTFDVPAGGYALGTRVVVLVSSNDATAISVADARSNSYTNDAVVPTVNSQSVFISSSRITTALVGGDVITATVTGSGIHRRGFAMALTNAPDFIGGVGMTGTSTTPNSTSLSNPYPLAQRVGIVRHGATTADFAPAASWTENAELLSGTSATSYTEVASDADVGVGIPPGPDDPPGIATLSFSGTLTASASWAAAEAIYGQKTAYFATDECGDSSNLVLTTPDIALDRRVVIMFENNGTTAGTPSIVDSRSNTWALDVTSLQESSRNNVWIASAKLTTALQTGDTITISFTGGAGHNHRLATAYDVGPLRDFIAPPGADPNLNYASTTAPATGNVTGKLEGVILSMVKYGLSAPSFTPAGASGFQEDLDTRSGGDGTGGREGTSAAASFTSFMHRDISSAGTYAMSGAFTPVGTLTSANTAIASYGLSGPDPRIATKVTVTTTARAMANATGRFMIFSAERSNTGPIFLGDSAINAATPVNVGYELQPGDTVTLSVTQLSRVYAQTTTGDQTLYILVG